MQEKENENKLCVSYVFKDHIERVFEIFKNKESGTEIYKDFMDYLYITKGDDFATKGNELKFQWKDTLTVDMLVKDVIDTLNYKKVHFQTLKVQPLGINYEVIYHYYWNTIERTTLYFVETIFDNPEILKYVNSTYNQVEKIAICKKAEKLLQKSTSLLTQMESVVILKNIQSVWNVITDWNIFKKYCPMVCESVSYEGSSEALNTKMHLLNGSMEKTCEYHLKVIESRVGENQRNYTLDLYDGVPKSPQQELQFLLIDINEKCTFLSFKHVFKQPIKYDLIYAIQKDKKQILSLLKKNLEREAS
jgi:hypothetical protein